MSNDTDEPVFAKRFHMVIYHLALNKYAVVDNDPELFTDSDFQYRRIYNRMMAEYLSVVFISKNNDMKDDTGRYVSSDSAGFWYE